MDGNGCSIQTHFLSYKPQQTDMRYLWVLRDKLIGCVY